MTQPKKSDRIAAFVETLAVKADSTTDPRYLGYFECFNRGDYYEAHDVLEDLWLKTNGPDREFYKALIQIAGAFVHLRKQHEHPDHPHHGRRLTPASRIFRSAIARLAPFAPHHLGVDVASLLRLCTSTLHAIESGDFSENPWSPVAMPQIPLTRV
ncbi:MAG: DUF309 domain-containing protein [Luteolibacter sp.]